jgi:hypothetical protein
MGCGRIAFQPSQAFSQGRKAAKSCKKNTPKDKIHLIRLGLYNKH